MRVTSQEYKTLRHSVGSYYAIRVTCGNAVYTEADIVSINISSSLFADSGPQIGQANSAFCELVLREESENWPRMAEFTVDIKILDSEGESTVDWLPMGTYYTDERVEDKEAGTLTISAYDGMLLMEQYWTDAIAPEDIPENWPITSKAWLDLIENAGIYTSGNLLTAFADFPEAGGYPIVNFSWSADKTKASVKCNTSVNYYNYIGIYDPWEWEMPSALEYGVPYEIHYSTTDPNVKLHIEVDGDTEDYTGDAVFTVPEGGYFYIQIKIEKNCTVDAEISISIPEKIEIDNRSVIDDTIPIVGLDTANTVRDVLKTIAAAHGGNWVMTFENKLRLVQFGNASVQNSAIAGIAIAGIAVVGVEGGSGGSSGIDSEYLGFKVQSLETTPELEAITGVHLETDSGTVMEYGDDSGYVLQGVCNTSNTSGVAELCFDKTQDYIYRPFSATVAQLDPAAEIGDAVVIKNEVYQMMKIDWTISTWPTADISAAYDEEVDHEYKVVSEQGKNYRKLVKGQEELGKRYTELKQTEEYFEITVGDTYETKTDAQDKKDDSDNRDNDLNDRQNEFAIHYRWTANGEIIGRDGSNKSIRLANDGINLMVDNEPTVVITQDEMYAPKRTAIPLSGSLQMGNFLFQPRSSGNMSLLWVGES